MDPGEKRPSGTDRLRDRLWQAIASGQTATGAKVRLVPIEERKVNQGPVTSALDDVLKFGESISLNRKQVGQYWRRLITGSTHVFEARGPRASTDTQKMEELRRHGIDVYELPKVEGHWLGHHQSLNDGDLWIAYFYESGGKYTQIFERTPDGPAMTAHIGESRYYASANDLTRERKSYLLRDDGLSQVLQSKGTLQTFAPGGSAEFFENYIKSKADCTDQAA